MSDGGRLTARSAGAWTDRTLRARISDGGARVRHPGGSPDLREIAAYRSLLPTRRRLAVVLGMTPELRAMAAGEFDQVLALDVSAAAVALYRDWVDAGLRSRESVVRGNWLDLEALIGAGRRVDAVLGDGVFGNLAPAEHEPMLEQLRAVLAPGGRVVVRQALVPAGTVVEDEAWPALRGRHRGGLLDDAELGFGVRLVGHLGCCWDGCRLDNAALFGEVDRQAAAGCWRPRELAAIARYRFDGSTALLAEGDWAAVVAGSGFDLREHPLSGRDWYRYYRVQQLTAV